LTKERFHDIILVIVENMFIKTNKSKSSSGKVSVYHLLCESYWENGVSKTRTILNLSKFPSEVQLALQQYFSKSSAPKVSLDSISVESSIDYGYFFVLLEIIKNLRIDELFEKVYPENSNLVLLMIIGKIITRGSKLAIVSWIKRYPVLAEKLNIKLSKLDEKVLYSVLDDLDNIHEQIEHKWNIYHGRKSDSIYLYDITSFYFEGTENELARYGYDRDKKKGKKIITAGLIADSTGMPLKVKVFEGNMNDFQTVEQQIAELKEEFNTKEIIFVGDRGMRIRYNLENMQDHEKQGVKYITGLTTDEIKELVSNEIIQLNLFQKELVEVESENKRYILCSNPKLAEEKKENRKQKKEKFELEIVKIQQVYESKKNQIAENKEKMREDKSKKNLKTELTKKEIDSWKYRIRKAQEKYGMQKIYTISLTEEEFKIEYDLAYYKKLEEYDGKYVFETTVSKDN